jgi:isopenicillin-N N-acyltransferase like protein
MRIQNLNRRIWGRCPKGGGGRKEPMPNNHLPIIEARGTHREVGQQIGSQCKDGLQSIFASLRDELPKGATWEGMLEQSKLYLKHSRTVYPQYIEELEGIADGANIRFEDVFLLMCEELWEDVAWHGCTDMAARGKATADGTTLIAHTNDLLPETESKLVVLKVQAGSEPEFIGISVGGIAISAGYNAAKISLTGNQLDANDTRPGVPRLLVVRAILGSKTLSEAMTHCLLPTRASSYNNVLADGSGEVYSMEGSATDLEAIYIADDVLAHANHYVTPSMRRFERDRGVIANSIIRHNRADHLLRQSYGNLTPELFQTLLADHAGFPTSICKHGTETQTVFSIIIQLETLKAWIGRGHACETEYTEYQLKPYQG